MIQNLTNEGASLTRAVRVGGFAGEKESACPCTAARLETLKSWLAKKHGSFYHAWTFSICLMPCCKALKLVSLSLPSSKLVDH